MLLARSVGSRASALNQSVELKVSGLECSRQSTQNRFAGCAGLQNEGSSSLHSRASIAGHRYNSSY